MSDYTKDLATYVEVISDDFESTFSVVDSNSLANMLGLPGDFDRLTKIIHKYIPGANIEYTKTNQLKGDYDIYIINRVADS